MNRHFQLSDRVAARQVSNCIPCKEKDDSRIMGSGAQLSKCVALVG